MKWLLVPTMLCLTGTTALAQAAPTTAPNANVASVRQLQEIVKGYVTRAAEKMPDEHFAFKPTPEVRSYGAILGHIANANYLMCSSVKVRPTRSKQRISRL